jgi:hypothetical protein
MTYSDVKIAEVRTAEGGIRTYDNKERRTFERFTLAIRLITLSPPEFLCALVMEPIKDKLLDLFKDEDDELYTSIKDRLEMMASIMHFFSTYAKVGHVMVPGVPITSSEASNKVMRIDQVLTIYNAVTLLFEYSNRYAQFTVTMPDGKTKVASSAIEILKLIYSTGGFDKETKEMERLRNDITDESNEYASALAKMEKLDLLTAEQKIQLIEDITDAANALIADNKTFRFKRAIDGSGSMFPELLKGSQPNIKNSDKFTAREYVDAPKFKAITDNVVLFLDLIGMSGMFRSGSMDALVRPGKSLNEVIEIRKDLPNTILAFREAFAKRVREEEIVGYLNDRELYRKKRDLHSSFAVIAAMLARLNYDPNAVAMPTQVYLANMVNRFVFMHPTEVISVIPIRNPHLTAVENLTLLHESHIRDVERLGMVAPETAKVMSFMQTANQNEFNTETFALYVYGNRGIGKSTAGNIVCQSLLGGLTNPISSQTENSRLAPDQNMLIPIMDDEFTAGDNVTALKNLVSAFMHPSDVTLSSGAAAAARAAFNTDIKRQRMGQVTRSDGKMTFGLDVHDSKNTVDAMSTSNGDPLKLDGPYQNRQVWAAFCAAVIDAQKVGFRRMFRKGSPEQIWYDALVHDLFQLCSVSYYLLVHCKLGTLPVNPYVVSLMLYLPKRLMEPIAGISFMELKDNNVVPELKNADEKMAYQLTQNAIFTSNLKLLMDEIARNKFVKIKETTPEGTRLSQYDSVRQEIEGLFEVLSAGRGPVQLTYGKSGTFLNPRAISNMMKLAERSAFMEMVIKSLNLNLFAAGFSTENRYLQIISRCEEMYSLHFTDMIGAMRLVSKALDPLGQDSILALGALLAHLMSSLLENHRELHPTPQGYWKFPGFFTQTVEVGRRDRKDDSQAKRKNGRPILRPFGNASSADEKDQPRDEGQLETQVVPLPLPSRPQFLQNAISQVFPDIWGDECVMWRIFWWTRIGTMTIDPTGNQFPLPYLNQSPFLNLDDTALYISKDIGTVYNVIRNVIQDLVCSNSKPRHFLTGNVVTETKNGQLHRYLEAAVIGEVSHDHNHYSLHSGSVAKNEKITREAVLGVPYRAEESKDRINNDLQLRRTMSNEDAYTHSRKAFSKTMSLYNPSLSKRQERAKISDQEAKAKHEDTELNDAKREIILEYEPVANLRPSRKGVDPMDRAFLSNPVIGRTIRSLTMKTLDKEFGRCAKTVRNGQITLFTGKPSMMDPLEPTFLEEMKRELEAKHSMLPGGRIQVGVFRSSTDSFAAFEPQHTVGDQKMNSSTMDEAQGKSRYPVFAPNGKSPHSTLTSTATSSSKTTGTTASSSSSSNSSVGASAMANLNLDRQSSAEVLEKSLLVNRWNNFLDAVQYEHDNLTSHVFVPFVFNLTKPNIVRQVLNNERALRQIPDNTPEATALKMIAEYVDLCSDPRGLLTQNEIAHQFPEFCLRLLHEREKSNAKNYMLIAQQKRLLYRSEQFMYRTYAADLYPVAQLVGNEIEPIGEWDRPLLKKLPPVVLHSSELEETLRELKTSAGSTLIYGNAKQSSEILFSLDYEGVVESQIRYLLWGKDDYERCPGAPEHTSRLFTLMHQMYPYLIDMKRLSSFSPCSINSQTGQLSFDGSSLPTRDFLVAEEKRNSNPYLPVPQAKETQCRQITPEQMRGDIVDFFLLFLTYMRCLFSTKNKLCNDPLDLTLYQARALGINWFQTAVRIVAANVVSKICDLEELYQTVSRQLAKYANSVIMSTTAQAKETYSSRFGNRTKNEFKRLNEELVNQSVDNRTMSNCMYIPEVTDIPMSSDALIQELGLAHHTPLDVMNLRVDEKKSDAPQYLSSADLRSIVYYSYDRFFSIELVPPGSANEPALEAELAQEAKRGKKRKSKKKNREGDEEGDEMIVDEAEESVNGSSRSRSRSRSPSNRRSYRSRSRRRRSGSRSGKRRSRTRSRRTESPARTGPDVHNSAPQTPARTAASDPNTPDRRSVKARTPKQRNEWYTMAKSAPLTHDEVKELFHTPNDEELLAYAAPAGQFVSDDMLRNGVDVQMSSHHAGMVIERQENMSMASSKSKYDRANDETIERLQTNLRFLQSNNDRILQSKLNAIHANLKKAKTLQLTDELAELIHQVELLLEQQPK